MLTSHLQDCICIKSLIKIPEPTTCIHLMQQAVYLIMQNPFLYVIFHLNFESILTKRWHQLGPTHYLILLLKPTTKKLNFLCLDHLERFNIFLEYLVLQFFLRKDLNHLMRFSMGLPNINLIQGRAMNSLFLRLKHE